MEASSDERDALLYKNWFQARKALKSAKDLMRLANNGLKSRRLPIPYDDLTAEPSTTIAVSSESHQSNGTVSHTILNDSGSRNIPSSWLSVPVELLTETPLILAVLAKHPQGLNPRELFKHVKKIKKNLLPTTLANIGTREAQAGRIKRFGGVWHATYPNLAPVIESGRAWCASFGKYELAAIRREKICKLLGNFAGGLQATQILEQLEQSDLPKQVPLNKDLVKADLVALVEDHKIKKVGSSKKYALTQ